MSACETCWADAYIRTRALGGHQVDHYERLLIERADDPDHATDALLIDAVANAEATTPTDTSPSDGARESTTERSV